MAFSISGSGTVNGRLQFLSAVWYFTYMYFFYRLKHNWFMHYIKGRVSSLWASFREDFTHRFLIGSYRRVEQRLRPHPPRLCQRWRVRIGWKGPFLLFLQPTIMPSPRYDWPGVWSWERMQGFIFSVKLSLYFFFFSVTFCVNKWVQSYECLPGETESVRRHLNNNHIPSLSMTAPDFQKWQ